MALISPELYDSGLKAIELINRAGNGQTTSSSSNYGHQSSVVPSDFQLGYSPHRDSGGCPTHYDLLVSAGTHTKAELSVPELGVHLFIGLETVVAVCGKVFLHEVADCQEERGLCVPLHEGQCA